MNRHVPRLLAPALEGLAVRIAEQRRPSQEQRGTSAPATEPVPDEDDPGSYGALDRLFDRAEPGADADEDTDQGSYGALDRLFDRGEPGAEADEDTDSENDRDAGPEERRKVPWWIVLWGTGVLLLVVVTALLVQVAVTRPDPSTGEDTRATRAPVPAPPAGAPREGSYVQARITPTGDVVVEQWVRSRAALSGVHLSLPAVPSGNGSLAATSVSVASDGGMIREPGTVDTAGRRLFFDVPPKFVYVRYTLRGAVRRSPTGPGRALVVATALNADHSPRTGRSQSRITLLGTNVLSTACAESGSGVLRPCGAQSKGRWSVLLKGEARNDRVVAQVDLGPR